MTKRCALYTCKDANGGPLYVGISESPYRRLTEHYAKTDWMSDVFTVQIEWLPSRDEAMAAERQAITDLQPVWNIMRPVQSDVRRIMSALGDDEMARIIKVLEVKERSLRLAIHRGVFPSSWFVVISDACDAAGIPCPRSAFTFKSPSAGVSSDVSQLDSRVLAGNANGSGSAPDQGAR